MKTSPGSVRLSTEELSLLRRAGRDTNKGVGDLVRDALHGRIGEIVADMEQANELARQKLSPDELAVTAKLGVSAAGYLSAKH